MGQRMRRWIEDGSGWIKLGWVGMGWRGIGWGGGTAVVLKKVSFSFQCFWFNPVLPKRYIAFYRLILKICNNKVGVMRR